MHDTDGSKGIPSETLSIFLGLNALNLAERPSNVAVRINYQPEWYHDPSE